MRDPGERVKAYLRSRVPALFGGRAAVGRVAGLGPCVWAVTLQDGRRLVAKHHLFGRLARGTPHDLLRVETLVLGMLCQAGCPVPRVLGQDTQAHVLFLEHAGELTLDDLAQENPAAARACAPQVAGGHRAIEWVLEQREHELLPHLAPGAGKEDLATGWQAAGEQAQRGLAALSGGGADRLEAAQAALSLLLRRLGSMPAALGSTDYNARNVVVGPDGVPRFLEFAKIGWDWSARRLVQYATSLGAGRPRGRFLSLLGGEAAARYAQCGGDREALDGHQLVFWLNAAALLQEAVERPGDPRHRRLLAAWGEPQGRLAQMRQQVGQSLSPAGPAQAIRDLLGWGPGREDEREGGHG
ncbi:MAG: hypothetical protein AB1505_04700 [Candidatus Latescibacterota bacterium]